MLLQSSLSARLLKPLGTKDHEKINHRTQAGARASANLYSLIETAKAHGLEPYAYLRRVFKELPLAETVNDIDALLPGAIKGGVLRRIPLIARHS